MKTTSSLTIALAQIHCLVGDIEGNTQKIMLACQKALAEHIDVIVFPELSLSGYSPEDELYCPELYERIDKALSTLCSLAWPLTIILGHPVCHQKKISNQASVIKQGQIIAYYQKQHLPNYGVFDEKRYFSPGKNSCVITINQVKVALSICEDLWHKEPIAKAKALGAQLLLSLNASPFSVHQSQKRRQIVMQRAKEHVMAIAYVNLVGGQDELVFDGGSMIVNEQGQLCAKAQDFQPDFMAATLNFNHSPSIKALATPAPENSVAMIYQALVVGVRDYIKNNGFNEALVGLSGGIDSALTLVIASDAIGHDKIQAILMPSPYTASMSIEDALLECQTLGCNHRIIPIESIYKACLLALKLNDSDDAVDITQQNIQARVRGTLLMGLSNQSRAIVLAASNKSEMAVGYSTLYGDMVGGFCVLKDVSKTRVYQLAYYRNQLSPIIPKRVLERPPSAELAPQQQDRDHLPPYEIIDAVMELLLEKNHSTANIIKKGFDAKTVHQIIHLIHYNEYKRQQAPIGTRITERAFGKDWRYPLSRRES